MGLCYLRTITCPRCGTIFYICQSCWHNHKYCSQPCRTAARSESLKRARKKYRQTKNGRKKHKESENRRRMRKKGSLPRNTAEPKNTSVTSPSPSHSPADKRVDDSRQEGKSKNQPVKKNVTLPKKTGDHTSNFIGKQCRVSSILIKHVPRCCFCHSTGAIVDYFPRREYGTRGQPTPFC